MKLVKFLFIATIKGAVVTDFVSVTQYVYDNIIVDSNGNAVKTSLETAFATSSPALQSPETAPFTTQAAPSSVYESSIDTQHESPNVETGPIAKTTSSEPQLTYAPTTDSPTSVHTEPSPTANIASSSTESSSTPSTSADSSSGSGQTFDGDATFYEVGMGACGWQNDDSDFIAALNVDQFNGFGAMSNGNPVCGKKASISYNGKHTTVTITDKCPGCSHGDLDLSPAAFKSLADEGAGRIKISWQFSS